MVASVAVGYRLGQPHTVVRAHRHVALAVGQRRPRRRSTGARALGASPPAARSARGPGWGDPGMIPAGNTDLVLPAIGEEWGFAGCGRESSCCSASWWRARCARPCAPTRTTDFFLGAGPGQPHRLRDAAHQRPACSARCRSRAWCRRFSARATPRCSPISWSSRCWLGRNLRRRSRRARRAARHRVRPLKCVLAGAGAGPAGLRRALPGASQDRDYLARDAHSFEADGVKRPQHNPRLNSLAPRFRAAPSTTATASRWPPATGRSWSATARTTRRSASRSTRPARASTPGTTRSARPPRTWCWAICAPARISTPRNASLVEHDANRKLQGYEYAELAPPGALPPPARQPGDRARAGARPQCAH